MQEEKRKSEEEKRLAEKRRLEAERKAEELRIAREKEEAERMRNESQCELKPLADEMKRIFASVEGAFIPTFRGYARSFIGLDIDIDLRDVDGMTSLVINVNGYDRRSRFQLSESQQYFLDIALRFSLIECSKLLSCISIFQSRCTKGKKVSKSLLDQKGLSHTSSAIYTNQFGFL